MSRRTLSLRKKTPRARRDARSVDHAFESFYREHVADVYQYALAVLTNPADAEDVTQQTFLNAYRAFQAGERPHKPHNWLIKIAHNVCRMRWRQSSRRPQEVPLDHAAEPATLDDEKASLDEMLAALARLPFNQRAAIVMREVEGRSYSEIADVLNTSVPAVEALLFRARTNLRSRGKALGILTVAPLPGSLTTFFGGGGGGLLAAGGAAFGSDALLKVAAIAVSGVVAGGAGFKAVSAVAKPEPSRQMSAPTLRHRQAPAWANPVQRIENATGANVTKAAGFAHARGAARARDGTPVTRAPTTDPSTGDVSGPASAVAAPADGGSTAPQGPVAQTTTAATKIIASAPTQTIPTTPVHVPLPPPPPLPTVTVTVPTVTLPPLPPIPK